MTRRTDFSRGRSSRARVSAIIACIQWQFFWPPAVAGFARRSKDLPLQTFPSTPGCDIMPQSAFTLRSGDDGVLNDNAGHGADPDDVYESSAMDLKKLNGAADQGGRDPALQQRRVICLRRPSARYIPHRKSANVSAGVSTSCASHASGFGSCIISASLKPRSAFAPSPGARAA